ncbi:MAG: hypothetical protein ACD_39C01584G0001 [uncultured bacterium]|nr:MAG: hypothetical protein ACD_39C01584G0001 [uncultured bacterium]
MRVLLHGDLRRLEEHCLTIGDRCTEIKVLAAVINQTKRFDAVKIDVGFLKAGFNNLRGHY